MRGIRIESGDGCRESGAGELLLDTTPGCPDFLLPDFLLPDFLLPDFRPPTLDSRLIMFRFEKLDVWQKSIAFAKTVYELTARYPSDERFGLTSQMRRAAVSISSNIAEGSGRKSDTEFIRFHDIAYSSVLEVVSQLHLSRSLSILAETDFQSTYSLAEELTRMLSGLRSSLEPGRRG